MKRLPEEQLKDMFARLVMPEHDAHRAVIQARILESTTQSTSKSRQKSRRFVFRFALPGLALASAVIGIITVGSPALRSEFVARTNNTNSIIESIVPQELIAESIQNTFAANDGIRHVVFRTVREDVNPDGKHPEVKEKTSRIDQEYYIAPNAFTGYRYADGEFIRESKNYRMTTLKSETQSIVNCQIYIDPRSFRIKENTALLDESPCKETSITDYAGFAEHQPVLDIQDLSYDTALDSEQMSFTTAEPIDPQSFALLITEPSFVKYLSELVDAQNNLAFAPIGLSPLGNVYGAVKEPEWNVAVNGRYRHSFAYMLDGRYSHDALTDSTQLSRHIFSEVQLQVVQLKNPSSDTATVQEKGYDPALFTAASQVFQMQFSDEWKFQGATALTHTSEDILNFNAHRLATRQEIFTNNSGETFFNYIAGGSAMFSQLRDVTPRIEGAEYVYAIEHEWSAESPDMHTIATTEVRIDSQTRLLTSIIERYDYPGMKQSTIYTTTFDVVKTIGEDPVQYFSVDAWKERAKEIIISSYPY